MKLVWDRDKAAANPKKHEGVTFEEAKEALYDPFALTHEDDDAPRGTTICDIGYGWKRTNSGGGLHLPGRINTAYFSMESK